MRLRMMVPEAKGGGSLAILEATINHIQELENQLLNRLRFGQMPEKLRGSCRIDSSEALREAVASLMPKSRNAENAGMQKR